MEPSAAVDSPNQKFAIPGIVNILAGQGGLPKIEITSPQASAEIYLHGAHLTSWRPAGFEEVIFTSAQSRWEEGRAIRGGIPICFPWFRAKADNPQAPAHGFVRTIAWDLESVYLEGDSVVVTLATQSSEASRKWWPYDFYLVHRMSVGAFLKLELIATNTGASPFTFEEALHTYHRVGDVVQTRISGLDATRYLDNRDGNSEKLQAGEVIMTAPTDNAYLDTQAPLEIIDPILRRRIHIDKQNSLTTVVWNPWEEGARSMSDMRDDEWRQMACVEASNILAHAIALAPGEQHAVSATVSVFTAERPILALE